MQKPHFLSTAPRRRPAGLLGWLAFAVAAAACGSPQADPPRPVSADTWATVDGRAIMGDDVDRMFRRAQGDASALSPEEAMTVKLSILNEMILQDILLAKASALNIQVTDAELDAAYAERRQNMTDEAFEQELAKRSLTADDLRETLRREFVTNKLLEQEIASKIAVTDQEITDFFNQNRAQFTLDEEAYHLAQIVVSPDRAPQPVNRTGNDATTPQEASFKVRMIMERLQAGASFADLAMDYSEDPETAPRGGDLGLVPVSALKQAPEPLRKAVIGQKPGTVNVAVSGGVHTIVAIVSHEEAGERDLSTPGVREAITEALRTRREQLLRTAYLSAARNDATVVNHAARRVVESHGK
jgi:peptidyl-prolyl cis-trans isomerase SurA